MKKIINIFAVIMLLFAVYSCTSEEALTKQISNTNTISVSDYSHIGAWHNAFLENVHKTFPEFKGEENIPTKSETINILLNINKEFAKKTLLPEFDIKKIEEAFNEYSTYAETKLLAQVCASTTPIKAVTRSSEDIYSNMCLVDILDLLNSKNKISAFGINLLQRLANALKMNYEKQTSDATLKKEVEMLITLFNTHNYYKESEEGEMIGTILAISIASIEWWEENPEALPDDSKVAPWVAADLAGALVSSATKVITTGSTDGIGTAAVAGAVTGSTGVVGKVAKVISKIL